MSPGCESVSVQSPELLLANVHAPFASLSISPEQGQIHQIVVSPSDGGDAGR